MLTCLSGKGKLLKKYTCCIIDEEAFIYKVIGERGMTESCNRNTFLAILWEKRKTEKDKWSRGERKKTRRLEMCIKIDKRTERENGDREFK